MPTKKISEKPRSTESNVRNMAADGTYEVTPIARALTPYKQKFGIPRQPQLANKVIGQIELIEPYANPLALDGLQQVSHIWVLFLFHQIDEARCRQLRVRPPRLGGNKKLGVFASRSTHRPNRIGQSLLEIDRIEGSSIYVRGIDLLDQTPIIDIKPYLPYVERPEKCHNHIATDTPPTIEVTWHARTNQQIHQYRSDNLDPQSMKEMINQCLAQDPRPAYSELDCQRVYGMRFDNFDIRFQYLSDDLVQVVELISLTEKDE